MSETLATENEIREVCNDLADMLIQKNRDYGDSALNPKRIFSRQEAAEGIKLRIDDKLSRIANDKVTIKEDSEWDLMGYLVLLQVAKRRKGAMLIENCVLPYACPKCGYQSNVNFRTCPKCNEKIWDAGD